VPSSRGLRMASVMVKGKTGLTLQRALDNCLDAGMLAKAGNRKIPGDARSKACFARTKSCFRMPGPPAPEDTSAPADFLG